VWVNEAHPAYRRAVASRSEGYHVRARGGAGASRSSRRSGQEHAFITAFLARWGAAIERRGGSLVLTERRPSRDSWGRAWRRRRDRGPCAARVHAAAAATNPPSSSLKENRRRHRRSSRPRRRGRPGKRRGDRRRRALGREDGALYIGRLSVDPEHRGKASRERSWTKPNARPGGEGHPDDARRETGARREPPAVQICGFEDAVLKEPRRLSEPTWA